jgi:hypothetical protein
VFSLRSVKCSLSRAAIPLPSRTPFRFPDPVTCSTPPSTCTSAHNQCYFSTHQPSRTNPTPHTSPSVVPLPSSRTLQLQHTTAVHRRCLCWQVLRSSAASWLVSTTAISVIREPRGAASTGLRTRPWPTSRRSGSVGAQGGGSGYRVQIFLCRQLPRMGGPGGCWINYAQWFFGKSLACSDDRGVQRAIGAGGRDRV